MSPPVWAGPQGVLFALLGTTDKAAERVRKISFAQQTPLLVFEFKVLMLVTALVVLILYSREFRSQVLQVLRSRNMAADHRVCKDSLAKPRS